jgi:hypothetical protein
MEILQVISAKLHLARRVVQDLTDNFKRLEDAERLEKSNTILDEVNSYLQIEENLIIPLMRRKGNYDDLIERIQTVHAEIDKLTEHAIMMHVDEPSGEYWKDMARLADLLDLADRTDHEVLFPWARVYLTEEDQYHIATNMKNQMVEESLPSSGMTIY